MAKQKVLIGMSGGVDSSVAAWLLQQHGFECIGCNMVLWDCGSDDAKKITDRMGIPLQVTDLRSAFRQNVIDRFVQVYEAGQTPNPCIDCNRTLKFGTMLDIALSQGCDAVATGHYARIQMDEKTGRYLLYKAKDITKDQTYFLYSLTQHQLGHTQFPLGALTKEEVREIAREQGFENARKRDSQDICFIPGGDYTVFLEEYGQKQYCPGNFLDLNGQVVGKHRGAVAYTLGQRKGLGLAMGTPVYVCGKDMAANTVTVGPNDALFTNALIAENPNWIPFPALTDSIRVSAKIRHSQHEQTATVYPREDGSIRVVFDAPQRAVTPGQAVVFYQGELVLGGATITKAYTE